MTTNFELRREVWEALGWRAELETDLSDSGSGRMQIAYWHSPKCCTLKLVPNCCDYPSHCLDADLPAIELDHGIALTELMEFCAANDYHWSVTQRRFSTPDGWFQCFLWRTFIYVSRMKSNDEQFSTKGETLAIAICRAIIEAAKVKS